MTIYQELLKRKRANTPIRVGVIGAGKMGFTMITQIAKIPGMKVTGVCDLNKDAAEKAAACYTSKTNTKIFVTDDFRRLIESPDNEIIIDATGVPEAGAKIALETLTAKKDIVLLNVEVDVTIGPLMNRLFENAGLVYTGSAGDEPAATLELYEFAKVMGLEVAVAGKGKNNPFYPDANPESCKKEAAEKRMSPRMLAAFQDGTKTMAEMNLLSNATGLVPDIAGMHGVSADLNGVAKILDLQKNGGVLTRLGVVEYVNGLAPGVFVIVKSELDEVNEQMRYLKIGDGPNYVLYRPYHLASLETPVSIARAVIERKATIRPLGAPVSETVAAAKREIQPGERIDGIGGYSVRGLLETHAEMTKNGHIPIGLIYGQVRAKKKISKGQLLTLDDVELDPSTTVWKLRTLQDQIFKEPNKDRSYGGMGSG